LSTGIVLSLICIGVCGVGVIDYSHLAFCGFMLKFFFSSLSYASSINLSIWPVKKKVLKSILVTYELNVYPNWA